MSKRKYEKKSGYWASIKKDNVSNAAQSDIQSNFEPLDATSSFHVSMASCDSTGGRGSSTVRRKNNAAGATVPDSLSNIRGMPTPYNYDGDVVDIHDAIQLCQKAYYNIGLFRNTIDIMVEFSNTNIRLKGGNAESKKFVKAWLEKIKINSIAEQFYRERLRSGNVFVFRMEGNLDLTAIKDMGKVYAATKTIPLKYTILNPANIVLQGASSYLSPLFKKLLSKYEIDALRNPKTEEEKAVFDALPENVKLQITKSNSSSSSEIYMPIDPLKLYAIFYKKQDYEPFAVPYGFPVLKDFNFKIELKNIDLAISRTIQNVTLLITMGAEKDKGGLNPKAMAKMQELFMNQSVARVVVSDYTTKGEFIIPDIGDILNPQKYEIVEKDIRDGLMLLIGGDGEKFSNQDTKVKIFIQRLNEGRRQFIEEFLQPEVKKVCETMGFKNYPKVFAEDIGFRDDSVYSRIYTRLLELGVLTPDQMFDALNTGVLPEKDDIDPAQSEFISQRKKGNFNPLVGGTPFIESAEGKATRKTQVQLAEMGAEADAKLAKEGKTSTAPNPNSPKNGRPAGASIENTKEVMKEFSQLLVRATDLAKATFKKKKLNKSEEDAVMNIAESIFVSSTQDIWEENVTIAFKDFSKIKRDKELSEEILALAAKEDGLGEMGAALIVHARRKDV